MKSLNKKLNLIRYNCLEAIYNAKSGHPGGCLSCVDIIFQIFKNYMPKRKNLYKKVNRNYFVLSKGHAAPALYSVVYHFNLISKNDNLKLRKLNSITQGHTHLTKKNLWMGANTGSLGQGLSFSIGYALGLKKIKSKKKVFSIIGDGESQEGQIWEAAMFASHHKIDNLCVFLDYNKLQSDNQVKNIMNLEPLKKKWQSFNWFVYEINGHSAQDILKAFKIFEKNKGRPTIFIAHTVKGKGVSFMENHPFWHGSVKMTTEQINKSKHELLNNKLRR